MTDAPRRRPPGVSRCAKNAAGERLADLAWPESPSAYSNAHGYYWSPDQKKWMRLVDLENPTNGDRGIMVLLFLVVGSVVFTLIYIVINLFGWLGEGSKNDNDNRCEQLSSWYSQNPGDTNPVIAEEYESICR
ncbi:hypothetical protein [Rhodococcoides corynebacterioides]|uniref:hypothetical protein n=1 Tax=Rhodococcoides corynebacterioides TaxID=53972 RepID=UPI003AE8FC15